MYNQLKSRTTRLTSTNRYTPGDVAVIHPVTFADDVDSFLANTGWSDTADDEFNFSLDSDSKPNY